MAIHGFPRATIDVEFVVPPDAVESVLACARDLGYALPARPLPLPVAQWTYSA